MEVTFCPGNEENTLCSIKKLVAEFGEEMHVGAGTVTQVAQVEKAAESGACYMISPNTDIEVIKHTKELGALSIPGALTPTEIQMAWNAGADFVKIFPASSFGVSYIKAVKAPLPHIPMLAVGGIDQYNMKEFINAGIKGFGIGSNIVSQELICSGAYEKLTELAIEYTSQFVKEG